MSQHQEREQLTSNYESERVPNIDKWSTSIRKRQQHDRRRVRTETPQEPSIDSEILNSVHVRPQTLKSIKTIVPFTDRVELVNQIKRNEERKLVERNSHLIQMVMQRKNRTSQSLISNFSTLREVFGDKESKNRVIVGTKSESKKPRSTEPTQRVQLFSYEQLERDRMMELKMSAQELKQSQDTLKAQRVKFNSIVVAKQANEQRLIDNENQMNYHKTILSQLLKAMHVAKSGSMMITLQCVPYALRDRLQAQDRSATIQERLFTLFNEINQDQSNLEEDQAKLREQIYEQEGQLHKCRQPLDRMQSQIAMEKQQYRELKEELVRLCYRDLAEYELNPSNKKNPITHHITLCWKLGEEFEKSRYPSYLTEWQQNYLFMMSLLKFERNHMPTMAQHKEINSSLVKAFPHYQPNDQSRSTILNEIQQMILNQIAVESKLVTKLISQDNVSKQLHAIFGQQAAMYQTNQHQLPKETNQQQPKRRVPSSLLRRFREIAHILK